MIKPITTTTIRIDTWEQWDELLDGLASKGVQHTPDDLVAEAEEMGCVEKTEADHAA